MKRGKSDNFLGYWTFRVGYWIFNYFHILCVDPLKMKTNLFPLLVADDALGDGVTGQSGGVLDMELFFELLPVFFDSLYADL